MYLTLPAEVDATTSDDSTTTTSVYVYPLEGDVDDCIGLLPKPGCGYEPTQAGDRGGALQFAVFGLIIVGVVVVFSVVFRNVIRRDKERAKRVE
ncbi:MAG: hypothetical protein RLZZ538_985 [Actinomycetota bacterium]|jgi:hypothetical protein|nr:hypothetical protein [Ilumatobacteraceae bacterium]